MTPKKSTPKQTAARAAADRIAANNPIPGVVTFRGKSGETATSFRLALDFWLVVSRKKAGDPVIGRWSFSTEKKSMAALRRLVPGCRDVSERTSAPDAKYTVPVPGAVDATIDIAKPWGVKVPSSIVALDRLPSSPIIAGDAADDVVDVTPDDGVEVHQTSRAVPPKPAPAKSAPAAKTKPTTKDAPAATPRPVPVSAQPKPTKAEIAARIAAKKAADAAKPKPEPASKKKAEPKPRAGALSMTRNASADELMAVAIGCDEGKLTPEGVSSKAAGHARWRARHKNDVTLVVKAKTGVQSAVSLTRWIKNPEGLVLLVVKP